MTELAALDKIKNILTQAEQKKQDIPEQKKQDAPVEKQQETSEVNPPTLEKTPSVPKTVTHTSEENNDAASTDEKKKTDSDIMEIVEVPVKAKKRLAGGNKKGDKDNVAAKRARLLNSGEAVVELERKLTLQRINQEHQLFLLEKKHWELRIEKAQHELNVAKANESENDQPKMPVVTINQYRYDQP